MDGLLGFNVALILWSVIICVILQHKGLLIPLLAGIGIDMGVML